MTTNSLNYFLLALTILKVLIIFYKLFSWNTTKYYFVSHTYQLCKWNPLNDPPPHPSNPISETASSLWAYIPLSFLCMVVQMWFFIPSSASAVVCLTILVSCSRRMASLRQSLRKVAATSRQQPNKTFPCLLHQDQCPWRWNVVVFHVDLKPSSHYVLKTWIWDYHWHLFHKCRLV